MKVFGFKVLKKRSESVEDLLGLSNMQLQSIISAAEGHSDDTRKLIAALSLLRKFQGTTILFIMK